jgi:hypothetical protein
MGATFAVIAETFGAETVAADAVAAAATDVAVEGTVDAAVAAGTDAAATVGTEGVFNAAVDSQLANVTIDAAGGDALAGYTAAGIPSVASPGGGGGLLDSLTKLGSSKVGQTVLGSVAGSAATGLLTPKPEIPPPPVQPKLPMPDPLAQQAARNRSIVEQFTRRGRASTILTNSAGSGGGKLG